MVKFLARGWQPKVALVVLALMVVIAAAAAVLAPMDPNELSADILQGPSGSHLMGTDQLGRDVMSRFLLGSRTSLVVAAIAVTGASLVGCLIGAVAGWRYETWVDNVLMRGMDVILAFPLLIIVPVISGILIARTAEGQEGTMISSIMLVSLVIAFVEIPTFARILRGSVISESRAEYVTASRSFGTRAPTILIREVLPNVAAPIIVQAAFTAAIAIMVEAAVSFLGFGIQPPASSWGLALSDGRSYVALGAWWLVLFPSLGIVLTVFSVNILGDELRDHLDPSLEGLVVSSGR